MRTFFSMILLILILMGGVQCRRVAVVVPYIVKHDSIDVVDQCLVYLALECARNTFLRTAGIDLEMVVLTNRADLFDRRSNIYALVVRDSDIDRFSLRLKQHWHRSLESGARAHMSDRDSFLAAKALVVGATHYLDRFDRVLLIDSDVFVLDEAANAAAAAFNDDDTDRIVFAQERFVPLNAGLIAFTPGRRVCELFDEALRNGFSPERGWCRPDSCSYERSVLDYLDTLASRRRDAHMCRGRACFQPWSFYCAFSDQGLWFHVAMRLGRSHAFALGKLLHLRGVAKPWQFEHVDEPFVDDLAPLARLDAMRTSSLLEAHASTWLFDRAVVFWRQLWPEIRARIGSNESQPSCTATFDRISSRFFARFNAHIAKHGNQRPHWSMNSTLHS
jgi:hypothetical protein